MLELRVMGDHPITPLIRPLPASVVVVVSVVVGVNQATAPRVARAGSTLSITMGREVAKRKIE